VRAIRVATALQLVADSARIQGTEIQNCFLVVQQLAYHGCLKPSATFPRNA
jgi:hypothetical protein